jgi:integrase
MPGNALIITYRQERLAGGTSPGTVNYEVGSLHGMMLWGARHKIIGSSPLAGVKSLPHLPPKDGRALEPAEVRALLDASSQRWRDVWYTYLVTGIRLNELVRLTFEDIDWEARELVIRPHKTRTRRERRIPIDNGLWTILKRQEAGRADRRPSDGGRFGVPMRERFSDRHVFVGLECNRLTGRTIHTTLMKCCARAGVATKTLDAEGLPLEHVDVHSLRRTFATELIVNGADPKSVQGLLGHKTLAMTVKLYAKVRPQNKRQAVARLSYGEGVTAPAHLVEFPATVPSAVHVGHQSDTASATGS